MFSTFAPAPKRKLEGFMEPTNTFTYCEDIWGRRNSEESDEGPADRCFSDSEEEQRASKRPRNKSFQESGRLKSGWHNPERFGVIKPSGKQRNSLAYPPTSRSAHAAPATPTQALRKNSIQTPPKLRPKKYGFFATPATKKMQMDAFNSAGEALDAMLGPRDTGDVEDGLYSGGIASGYEGEEDMRFDTPIKQPVFARGALPPNPYLLGSFAGGCRSDRDEEEILPEVDGAVDGRGRKGGRGRRGDRRVVVQSPEPQDYENGGVQSAAEGDVEDNASDVDMERRGTSSARAGGKDRKQLVKQSKPKYSLRRRVLTGIASSPDAGTPRRSSRRSSIAEGKITQTAVRSPATRARQLAASNRSKMTARAATMRQKAKKLPSDKKAEEDEYFRAVYGRKPRVGQAGKAQSAADESDLEDYYRAVYGRKKRKGEDPAAEEYAEVVTPAKARKMEERAGWVEVSVVEVVDINEYERGERRVEVSKVVYLGKCTGESATWV